MIRVLLVQQLDNKSFKEKRKITLAEVSKQTGISRATLTRIANTPGYTCTTETINSLCKYFECEPGKLLQYFPDEEEDEEEEEEKEEEEEEEEQSQDS